MTGSRAAIRYAKAILSYAQEQGLLEAVHGDMLKVIKVVGENEELRTLIASPVIKAQVKSNVLKEVFEDFSDASHKLIALLLENNRIEIFEMVAEKFMVLYDELKGKQKAVVTTAVPLTEALEQKILEKVQSLTGKDVSLEKVVDETIIGGFILRVGDQQFDASIANKLSNLKRDFVNTTVVSA
ncbi:ATP synthase F1 subunit delta [Robertkochia marina]|uniref:ATP synthase subunit delta n=1 Tax=Robertkochia marina TaxID=1227945 RepID=A0A4S3M565_9FLAO|nr:ATP synthase F1 subunit delta [Robertkochia marina]THD69357.1 ATP synthase F1 subunit delta [Robertkochia marina]TRZ47382.1 ATP synthase F1 subunit delta [Robertkochia marina]